MDIHFNGRVLPSNRPFSLFQPIQLVRYHVRMTCMKRAHSCPAGCRLSALVCSRTGSSAQANWFAEVVRRRHTAHLIHPTAIPYPDWPISVLVEVDNWDFYRKRNFVNTKKNMERAPHTRSWCNFATRLVFLLLIYGRAAFVRVNRKQSYEKVMNVFKKCP